MTLLFRTMLKSRGDPALFIRMIIKFCDTPLSEKEQKVVSGLAEKGKIKLDAKTAKCVRGMALSSVQFNIFFKLYICQ